MGSVRGPFGVRLGSVHGPLGIRLGSFQGPFRIRLGPVRGPFGIRSGSVPNPFRVRSGSVCGLNGKNRNLLFLKSSPKRRYVLSKVVSGDGWSLLARPLIERHPATAFIFLGVIFTFTFGFLNIIVAVMIENAADSKAKDHQRLAALKVQAKSKTNLNHFNLIEQLFCSIERLFDQIEMI